jgi:SAM-dependent methyltransferase
VTVPASAGVEASDAREAMRFALPWRTRVAVIAPAGELPDLGGARETEALPLDSPGEFAAMLEAARARGCEYLLAPREPRLPAEARAALADRGTRVVDAGGYAVFSLHPPPPAEVADGLPLPPAHLIRVTSGCLRQAVNRPEALYDSYLESGAQGAACIRSGLEGIGLDVARLGSILDFGCGCGRLVRHWRDLDAEVHGCDYNPLLVDWCRDALGFANFRRNGLEPRLPYDDAAFGLVYAVSIFTHLDAGQQLPWMAELARVVRPGGVLLVTVAGASRAARQLDGPDSERFDAGELVVRRADLAGTNACAAFHPRRYIEETLSSGLELAGLVPDGAADVRQDQVLLRKPAGAGGRG